LIFLLVFPTACGSYHGTTNPASPFPTPNQTSTAFVPLPTGTYIPTVSVTFDDLIALLEISDPVSPTYNPGSPAYAEFPGTLEQLAAMNASSNNFASMLAYAMGFPRKDSILAAKALISLGPDWAATELPSMISYLTNQRADVRMYSAIVLSITGNHGSCSLGNIGPLLWDPDPYVRTSAALAIQGITGVVLVQNTYTITPSHLSSSPVEADTPGGKITGSARIWWTDHGSKVNWHPSYDLCDP
jgi:hypothetical protein